MSFRLQPVRVRTGSDDTEGQLVFMGDYLVAVLVRLSDQHGNEAGAWFLEAGFDGVDDPSQPKFLNIEDAQDWIGERLKKQ